MPRWSLLAGLATAGFLLQLGSSVLGQRHGYGYFIDELYYLACAARLDLGYVDHPPLAPAVLRLSMALGGESISSIRISAALASSLTVLAAGWLAARQGAGGFGQAVAAVSVLVAPVFLVLFSFFSMNAFEILFWTAGLAILVLMVERQEPRLWVAFGFVCGLALLNKHTAVLLGSGAVLALLLTRQRKLLWTPWLLAGGAAALLLFLPNLLWQIEQGFPSLEFYRNATLFKNRALPPLRILWNQILFMGPHTFPVWAAGLYFCARERPALRFVAWTYLLLLAALVLSDSSRPDRIAGLYPVLFACGGVAIERRLTSARMRVFALSAMVAIGAASAPAFLPLLPPHEAALFVQFLGIDTQLERGAGKRSELPQWLADRRGWEELVEQVRSVYDSLPPEEREGATILAPSYGHAGAIELLGAGDLPPVLSPHNTYHLWGRAHAARLSRGVAISLGYDAADLEGIYDRVEEVARYDCELCMPWRDDMPIYVARDPALDPGEVARRWELARHFE